MVVRAVLAVGHWAAISVLTEFVRRALNHLNFPTMSDALRIAQTQPPGFSRSLPQRQQTYLPTYSSSSFQLLRHAGRLRLGFISKPKALTRNEDDALIDLPVSVQLQPIVSHGHFDQTITESPEPAIILWFVFSIQLGFS